MNLHIAPKNQGALNILQPILAIKHNLIIPIGNHIKIVITQLDILPTATNIQIFNELVSMQHQHLVLLQHFYE